MSKIKSLIIFLTFITLSFAFIGGDCGTETTAPPVTVLPPSNVDLTVDAIPGGNSYALVSWDPSSDEGTSDFKGYIISTYQLNSSDQIDLKLPFSINRVPKTTHTFNVTPVKLGTKYQTYITSEINDGTRSDSIGTKIYSGVYANSDTLFAFTQNGSTKSGYGWVIDKNIWIVTGQQYSYTASNASSIDIHIRFDGGLKFFSPDRFLSSGRKTLLGIVGTGSDAFNTTNLLDPQDSEELIVKDTVYLLKTQDGNYIKIRVKDIDSGSNKVFFDYKVQPITNLRIVKRK